jgi:hypothetical protein
VEREELRLAPTRGERSRELARTPCCDAPWVTPKSGRARDRYAVCSDCRKTEIQWEVTAPPASIATRLYAEQAAVLRELDGSAPSTFAPLRRFSVSNSSVLLHVSGYTETALPLCGNLDQRGQDNPTSMHVAQRRPERRARPARQSALYVGNERPHSGGGRNS